ncbi:hypothetical protein MYP_687 [Sporocytophaga myxococcoides]|uniref:Uncharacterized protein n=1 Tax=Sporocytophaga myxococcoides TaxID=153721 RepID=A0A098L998_9BACT|nr:hypothetical protein [Sporocytophaga myxococcoides]GAL83460.1 hypothetical protein MYP_687 [Sporocytophaga myxococcoides]
MPKWKLKIDSFTKAILYDKNGGKFTRYSMDWVHQNSKTRSKELGLSRLRILIAKYAANTETAIIYDNISGEELEKYKSGILVPKKSPSFPANF